METTFGRRSNKLIAEFDNGFAIGWHMAVKESFRSELDIKYLQRKKQKTTYYEWSQGPYFCFSEGQIIYDTPMAYERWDIALEHINIACQIIEAKPNTPARDDQTTDTNNFIENGYVKFLLLKPNEDRTWLDGIMCHKLSQNDFVDFLRTGSLNSNSGF